MKIGNGSKLGPSRVIEVRDDWIDELNYLKSKYLEHEPEKENCVLGNYRGGVLE